MWKPWNSKNNYKIPEKPENPDKQLSMIWDYVYNHLPSRLGEQDKRIWWQDMKLNFMFVFVALILACLGKLLFS